MEPTVSPKRFRVALSFPGEFRGRVEKIAEALAGALGRGKVLYDRWSAAEFARPNLDVYLSRLYHDESELIVVFLCKAYDEKEWCGLEWRACRDLLKRKKDDQLMFLRLDDADVSGLYSIDGYLDIRGLADADVARAILERVGSEDRPGTQATGPRHCFTSKLPVVNPLLIGREEQIALLDRAWADPAVNLVQVIAAGGTGKTALVDKWFRRHVGEATIFGWSFYSQGAISDSAADRQTSSDPFFADLIQWFHIDVAPTDSVYIKAEAVARRLREERVLLLLDGVEPLQDAGGALRDAALKALLQELATGHRGLVVCTTRVRMDIPEAIALDLDNLTPEQGAEYLRSLKVEGTDEELREASKEYWNHALALTLLGTYLADFCGADVRRRVEIPKLMAEDTQDGAHARRIITAYEKMFEGKPEAAILRALGYFNRPAESAALSLVRPKIDYRQYQAALKHLHGARLILSKDPAQPLDCHPLIREYFAATATRDGHARLYEYYAVPARYRPATPEEMTPLFHAVYHGCKANRHKAALDDIYFDRIRRGNEGYLASKLGAVLTDLSLLANFFETPWTQPVATLPADDQAWLMNAAGFELLAVGRGIDAIEPMRAGAEGYVNLQSWVRAPNCFMNLSDLHCTLGNVAEAVEAARLAVDCADRGGEWSMRMASRATLAGALHQSGDFADAMRLFAEAERIQTENQPEYPVLYSFSGYRYCDMLLDQGKRAEVLLRASQSLSWQRGRLLDIGLDHLLLGRAHPAGSAEAAHHLEQAVDFLRRAGTLDQLPRGLLARATPRDLDEVFRTATRSGMRLFLADYHLARGNLAEAERLIDETGYHRRDPQLADLRAKVGQASLPVAGFPAVANPLESPSAATPTEHP
jgi:tetratricopeptide (TPR) repeat protein